MSVSLYYSATRALPLSTAEQEQVSALINRYSIEDQLQEYFKTGSGFNWESFHVYERDDKTEPDVIFEGSTKPPDNSEAAIWIGLQHWCQLLTEIRRSLPGAVWHVHLDDHEIVWNEETDSFDPSI